MQVACQGVRYDSRKGRIPSYYLFLNHFIISSFLSFRDVTRHARCTIRGGHGGAGCSHAVETPLLRGDIVICIVIDPTPLAFCRYEFPPCAPGPKPCRICRASMLPKGVTMFIR